MWCVDLHIEYTRNSFVSITFIAIYCFPLVTILELIYNYCYLIISWQFLLTILYTISLHQEYGMTVFDTQNAAV